MVIVSPHWNVSSVRTGIFGSRPYPKQLKKGLAHSRPSTNICGMLVEHQPHCLD